jgi:2,3-bisphosphoglycerate-independent phosphoglycerate mutase
MDRDNRWDRVALAYDAMVRGKAGRVDSAADAVEPGYAEGKSDEFLLPRVVGDYTGMADGDGVFCLNFRADRARQILRAMGEPGFNEFDVGDRPVLTLLGMVDYSEAHNRYMTAAYPKRPVVNTIGSWVAQHGLRQFRLAETEKYPARHLLPQRRQGNARRGGGSPHGPLAQGRDL